ncbi:glycosyltransferase family 2 protein [Peptostreptococcus canis]|uniref:Glycosyltransferase family 2 protein n=1 Tax=Peptostreptococcus canis TaxID=1159213 RepID=A0ABR6TJ68_9FIRM|nr:glycosyltransferase family 2 protein [Peptostreptococcus canis]MBC2575461.1 glycosyltransferase family 2 protein [Peptostreptococcus canis]
MFLSIVIPCFNEEGVLDELYGVLRKEINKNEKISSYELIFVDDGSKDKTLEDIKRLKKSDDLIRYISFSRNFGKEAAIYAGLKASKGDLVVLMDADLQHPPELIHEMIDKIVNHGYDSVGTIRKNRVGESKLRAFLSTTFYKFINLLSDTEIKQNATDYRMMTRQFVNSVLDLSEYNRFTKGIFSWVGYNNIDIEYENIDRTTGTSKWNFMNLFKYSIEGIVAFSTMPLFVSSILGIVSFIISSVLLLIFFFKAIIFGEVVKGFPTVICSIFFLGGIQLLTIGILGQYLSKTYLEVKSRPIYISKEKSE